MGALAVRLGMALFFCACRAASLEPSLRWPAGGELVVAGERVPVDAPVVLWTQEPFYDAYSEQPRFSANGPLGKRYRPGREPKTSELAARVEQDGWTRALLAEQVDLFVIHYDACGTSRECFRVLQDERTLSVHFLLDLDGTLYQTLDLADQAWHARSANPRAIGVEVAHVGAFAPEERAAFSRGYEWTEDGVRLALERPRAESLRRRDFHGAPARPAPIEGEIHGARFAQYDFTPEQYESLAALTAALARVFPKIALDAPRDAAGRVRTEALSDDEKARFHGVLGHYHLQTDKRDPGPAFDWERLLDAARARAVSP